MKFTRRLSVTNIPVENQIKWKTVPVELKDKIGEVIFSMPVVEVPAEWSDTAAQILATKYFRKAGVPQNSMLNRGVKKRVDNSIPGWLQNSTPAPDAEFGSETSAKQVLHRLAGAWTYHGWKMGLFTKPITVGSAVLGDQNDEHNARIFYDELYLILSRQLAAPNSPQWFNTGLWWAYGIEGPPNGQWAINYGAFSKRSEVAAEQRIFQTSNSYEYPQPHACFIQPVADDLVNSGGIMDLWTREALLFKYGSGTGSNFSSLRGENEPLSGGGKSSGLMSFLEIGDRAAGAIKSGGTTRRAAKMVIVDADHPDIEKFIDWKAREEQKAAAMWIGSTMLNDPKHQEILSENGLLPMSIEDQLLEGMLFGVFGIDYEGEAIRSVGGQNANNTVRVRDEFMNLLSDPQGAMWYTKERTTGKLGKGMQVGYLWNKILRAAWASADPGLQFHDTINRWHTCKADGEIRASNPCSEYMFLDNTACNLASLNLAKFYVLKNLADPASYEFDVDLFCHVAQLMTVVLDISVTMASFPSKEIALGSYNYRTLGLGYANLGGLLMRMGLPYDSNEGRAEAKAITALMTGVAYETSALLANELGPFPRYEANAKSMGYVIDLHAGYANRLESTNHIANVAKQIWYRVFTYYKRFRNAQVTLLAPTGTIGLLMDCDTLGIEPDFSLVKHKNLAGGGAMALVNQAVEQALTKLSYNGTQRNLVVAYIKKHGTVEGCPDLQPEHLPVFDCATPPDGFSRSIAPMGHVNMMAAVQPFLSGAISKTVNMPNSATVKDVGEVYMTAWKLGLKAIAIYRDGSKLAQPLQTGTKKKPVREKDGVVTIENFWPGITLEFLGKVVPSSEVEIELSPLFEQGDQESPTDKLEKIADSALRRSLKIQEDGLARGVREYLPWRRESAYTQKVNINGQSVHLTVGRYPDGRAGEVRLDLSRVGTTLSAVCDMVAMMISIGLQYGVPVEEYVQRLSDRKFEPSGLVEGHENIKYVSSIGDFIARELGLTFLGRTEMGQAKGKPTIEELEKFLERNDDSRVVVEPSGEVRTTKALNKPAEEMAETAEKMGKILEIATEELDKVIKEGFNDVFEGKHVGKPVALTNRSGLEICPACGEAALTRSGTCQTCTSCGYNDGCGG